MAARDIDAGACRHVLADLRGAARGAGSAEARRHCHGDATRRCCRRSCRRRWSTPTSSAWSGRASIRSATRPTCRRSGGSGPCGGRRGTGSSDGYSAACAGRLARASASRSASARGDHRRAFRAGRARGRDMRTPGCRTTSIGGNRPKLTFIGWNERLPGSSSASMWPPVMWREERAERGGRRRR